VDLNNQGLEAMRLQDFAMASRLFAQACEKAPGEKGFWNNLLIATRKVKGNEIEAVKVAHQIVALDPGDAQAPYVAGLVYLNDLKRPAEAIPYLDYSLRVNPGDAGVALALANALEQAGYSDDAFEVLEKYARKTSADPYPLYLLGLQYLERKDYNAAIATLASARKLDNKGYSHDAYIRARYFAGQLDGLEQECRDVLRRFPEVLNRQSLERILLSLQAGDFRLVETISVKLSAASSIEKLDFLVKPVPDSRNHQHVDLLSAEFTSRGKSIPASIDTREAGRLRISVPREALAPEFFLTLVSRIRTQAMLGSRITADDQPEPDINSLMRDPMLNLDHPLLTALAERIARLPGNYVQNAVKAVSDGLRYRENYEDFSVEWALTNPDNCDCTEYSRLVAALCLKKGIAARVATGYLIKHELIDKDTSVGHAWCEVYFKGKGWVPIDPTLQANMHWAYFGNLLSDQILFDYINSHKRTRISIDFISNRPDLQVNLGNSYRISYWK
jgi:tetratricopeptide (TPR) repeat protein